MKHTPNYNSTVSHLKPFINPSKARDIVDECKKVLRKYKFDAIAFRGLSGALLAPIVAMEMKKSLIAVRKGEKCHTSNMVEGDKAAKRYVIVDDFIASGSTVNEILRQVSRWAPEAECLGVLQAHRIAMPLKHPDWVNYPEVFCTKIVEYWRRSEEAVKKARDKKTEEFNAKRKPWGYDNHGNVYEQKPKLMVPEEQPTTLRELNNLYFDPTSGGVL